VPVIAIERRELFVEHDQAPTQPCKGLRSGLGASGIGVGADPAAAAGAAHATAHTSPARASNLRKGQPSDSLAARFRFGPSGRSPHAVSAIEGGQATSQFACNLVGCVRGRLDEVSYKMYILGVMSIEYTTVPATELREHGSEIVNRVAYGGEELVLTRHGKPVAALVSLATLAALHDFEDQQDAAEAAAAREDVREHGAVRWEDVKAELHRA
jgi:prevent-host-death family protein